MQFSTTTENWFPEVIIRKSVQGNRSSNRESQISNITTTRDKTVTPHKQMSTFFKMFRLTGDRNLILLGYLSISIFDGNVSTNGVTFRPPPHSIVILLLLGWFDHALRAAFQCSRVTLYTKESTFYNLLEIICTFCQVLFAVLMMPGQQFKSHSSKLLHRRVRRRVCVHETPRECSE